MSRSYKKTPWCGDRKGKDKKRMANHKVRRTLNRDYDLNYSGKSYKKLYESWEVCDYGYICTWEEFWKSEWKYFYWLKMYFPKKAREPDKKECYRKWLKCFKNK